MHDEVIGEEFSEIVNGFVSNTDEHPEEFNDIVETENTEPNEDTTKMIDENEETQYVEEIPSLSKEEIGSILASVKIDMTSIDNIDFSEEPEIEEVFAKGKAGAKHKEVKEPKVKAGAKSSSIIKEDGKVMDLASEFAQFMEVNVKMKSDSGVKIVIPTGFDILDAIMGGGFAVGTFSTIVGPPGGGKSCLAANIMSNFQKVFPECICAYLDSEEAVTTTRLYNLGIRSPKIKPYNDITVEKVFKFLEGLCLFKEQKRIIDKPALVIWDSIANTLSEKERECEDVNSIIGFKARMLSILIPRYVAKLAKYNITVISINQLRDVISIGPYSAPKDLKYLSASKDMPGGTVLKYNAFHLLETKVSGTCDEEKYGFSGFQIKAKCVKNKLFSPNIEVILLANFVTGFSNLHSNYKFLVDNDRLQTGAWNFLRIMPEKKFRTKDFETLYKTDENFKNTFDSSVKECIDTVLIQPNMIHE